MQSENVVRPGDIIQWSWPGETGWDLVIAVFDCDVGDTERTTVLTLEMSLIPEDNSARDEPRVTTWHNNQLQDVLNNPHTPPTLIRPIDL